ncbi:ESPR-type extended signal peptide-containing protein [Escherichia coli]|uniref:ESPR-type extended signal peptide-containing protein n=1 Tax=Escherichia coli TaxID=562 RepID=UPI001588C290
MNKVYSLKYSARTKGLVAVSEHAKRTSKKGMKKKNYTFDFNNRRLFIYLSPYCILLNS